MGVTLLLNGICFLLISLCTSRLFVTQGLRVFHAWKGIFACGAAGFLLLNHIHMYLAASSADHSVFRLFCLWALVAGHLALLAPQAPSLGIYLLLVLLLIYGLLRSVTGVWQLALAVCIAVTWAHWRGNQLWHEQLPEALSGHTLTLTGMVTRELSRNETLRQQRVEFVVGSIEGGPLNTGDNWHYEGAKLRLSRWQLPALELCQSYRLKVKLKSRKRFTKL